MPSIVVKENEPLDRALYRYRKYREKEGIPSEIAKRAAYTKPSKRRKQKKYEAIIRMNKMAKKKNPSDEPL